MEVICKRSCEWASGPEGENTPMGNNNGFKNLIGLLVLCRRSCFKVREDEMFQYLFINSQRNVQEEAKMFEVTEKASDMIKDFLKDKDEFPPIRLMLSQGG